MTTEILTCKRCGKDLVLASHYAACISCGRVYQIIGAENGKIEAVPVSAEPWVPRQQDTED